MNKDIRRLLLAAPKLNKTLREQGVHCMDILSQREIEVVSFEYGGGDGFTLNLPLTYPLCGEYLIPMCFQMWDGSPVVSYGPQTYPASRTEVTSYVDWLDKHMPRHGEAMRDILDAGNPDNLIIK